MLVLTRKPEEDIVISTDEDEIVIRILKVQGGKVSIGIKADKKRQVVRKELLDSSRDSLKEDGNSNQETEEEYVLLGASNA